MEEITLPPSLFKKLNFRSDHIDLSFSYYKDLTLNLERKNLGGKKEYVI